jgi:hypothetical protein
MAKFVDETHPLGLRLSFASRGGVGVGHFQVSGGITAPTPNPSPEGEGD